MVVVAFSIPWNNWESIFVFPPFSLLLRVLCPITLQWETHSHSSPMAQSALVSYTVLISKFKYHHQILTIPESVSDSRHRAHLHHLEHSKPSSLLGLLKWVFSDLYSEASADTLLHSIKGSTLNQYSFIWWAFCSFVYLKNPEDISDSFVVPFLRHPFHVKCLALIQLP